MNEELGRFGALHSLGLIHRTREIVKGGYPTGEISKLVVEEYQGQHD